MSVFTDYGVGEIVNAQEIRGNKSFLVEGKGFSAWLTEKELRKYADNEASSYRFADAGEDNSTTLPYNPEPQNPAVSFPEEGTIQPIYETDPEERLSPSNSLTFEDESLVEPGPSPDLFASREAAGQSWSAPGRLPGGSFPSAGGNHIDKYIQWAHENQFDPSDQNSLEIYNDDGGWNAVGQEEYNDIWDHFKMSSLNLIALFRHDPVGYIERVGHMLSAVTHDPRMEDYVNLVENNRHIREAAWKDVRKKALRLRREGKVDVQDVGPNRIYARVEGDHGTYNVVMANGSKGGKSGYGLLRWSCTCPWGHWQWKRQSSFIGRTCSHAYATYLEMQSQATKGKRANPRKKSSGRFDDDWSEDPHRFENLEPSFAPGTDWSPLEEDQEDFETWLKKNKESLPGGKDSLVPRFESKHESSRGRRTAGEVHDVYDDFMRAVQSGDEDEVSRLKQRAQELGTYDDYTGQVVWPGSGRYTREYRKSFVEDSGGEGKGEEGPPMDLGQDESEWYQSLYGFKRDADKLRMTPNRLVPDFIFNDTETDHYFTDVEEDSRVTTGPGQISIEHLSRRTAAGGNNISDPDGSRRRQRLREMGYADDEIDEMDAPPGQGPLLDTDWPGDDSFLGMDPHDNSRAPSRRKEFNSKNAAYGVEQSGPKDFFDEDEGIWVTPEGVSEDFKAFLSDEDQFEGFDPNADYVSKFVEQYPYAEQMGEGYDQVMYKTLDNWDPKLGRRQTAGYDPEPEFWQKMGEPPVGVVGVDPDDPSTWPYEWLDPNSDPMDEPPVYNTRDAARTASDDYSEIDFNNGQVLTFLDGLNEAYPNVDWDTYSEHPSQGWQKAIDAIDYDSLQKHVHDAYQNGELGQIDSSRMTWDLENNGGVGTSSRTSGILNDFGSWAEAESAYGGVINDPIGDFMSQTGGEWSPEEVQKLQRFVDQKFSRRTSKDKNWEVSVSSPDWVYDSMGTTKEEYDKENRPPGGYTKEKSKKPPDTSWRKRVYDEGDPRREGQRTSNFPFPQNHDQPFQGSGPVEKPWYSSSEDYVKTNEIQHRINFDGDGITKYTDDDPQQFKESSLQRFFLASDRNRAEEMLGEYLYSDEWGEGGEDPGEMEFRFHDFMTDFPEFKKYENDLRRDYLGSRSPSKLRGFFTAGEQQDRLSLPIGLWSREVPVEEMQAEIESLQGDTRAGAGDRVKDLQWAIERRSPRQGMRRVAGRQYSLAQQDELVNERHQLGARNLDELDLEGTHYLEM